MALNICIEYFWRALFILLNYCIDNFIFVLILLGIIGLIRKMIGSALAIGAIAFLINMGIDFLVVGTGGLTTPITLLGGAAIGALWAMMTLFSDVSILIKIPNALLVFIFGLIWGWAPIPFPIPLAPFVGFLLQNYRLVNYFIGLFSLGLLFIAFTIQLPILIGFCQGLDFIVNLF